MDWIPATSGGLRSDIGILAYRGTVVIKGILLSPKLVQFGSVDFQKDRGLIMP